MHLGIQGRNFWHSLALPALSRRKLALVRELIATDEAVMKHLTREDIEELLR